MKEIEYYIESNTKILEELWDKLDRTNPDKEPGEIKRLTELIKQTKYYIMGLKDAKRYIEKEQNNEN